MRRWFVLVLGLALCSIPASIAQDDPETGQEACIEPPEIKPDYEWAYEMDDGRTRFVEVLDTTLATTPQGRYNVTEFGFAVHNEDDEREAWGRTHRMADTTPMAWGVLSQDTWLQTEDGVVRQIDSYDPSLNLLWHYSSETCPGDYWRFTTEHGVSTNYGGGATDSNSVEEQWQVRADGWTEVSVPDGSYDALKMEAVRSGDRYKIETYWSPEVMGPVKIAQGTEVPTTERELTWHILDQRPTARFKAEPHAPTIGETITLNGTPSFDPEGNITAYEWNIDGEIHEGPLVEIETNETTTIRVRLFVTDEANRTSTLGHTIYVAPDEDEGVAVDGAEQAHRGEIVTLRALTPFDPIDVRWRADTDIIGKGETFQFRMNETRTIQVDATHENGHVFTANHTVELLGPSDDGPDDRADAVTGPPNAPSLLAILEPLEGQIVPSTFDVRVMAKTGATLTADGYPLWSGEADPPVTEQIELDPGSYELELSDGNVSHRVNVTVSEAHGLDERSAAASSEDEGASPTPGAGVVGLVVATVAAGLVARRERE